jgi:hypothetical protein
LVEIGKDEHKLATKLDDALRKLNLAKVKYEFVRQKAEVHLPEELDAVRVRARDAVQDIVKARELVESVVRDFRRIELECVYNQLPPATLAQYGKFANFGDRLLGENPRLVSADEADALRDSTYLTPETTFPRTARSMADAHIPFDADAWPNPTEVTNAQLELSRLEIAVAKYRRMIGESQDRERLTNQLRKIRENQDRIRREIREAYIRYEEEQTATTPKIAPVGQMLLAKGESKKVRQGIEWRNYRSDDITIKLTSSDPAAVIVPAELKLDFERNSLEFEYELRAGSKEGNYTVTLTPNEGKPVVIQVQVK